MKLNDSSIAHIAKLIQMALLTGTDIVDHLRMMELEDSDGSLVLGSEYAEVFDHSLQKMIENAATKTAE